MLLAVGFCERLPKACAIGLRWLRPAAFDYGKKLAANECIKCMSSKSANTKLLNMQKLIKTNPPKVRWVAIDEQKPSYDGTLFVFGLINKGSPHEVFSTFFAVYDKESDKFFDFHGDTIYETVTHWMNVE